MKYATFDGSGKLNGRYDSSIHTSIPNGAVELSDEAFLQTINETDGIWKLVNGVVTKTAFPPVAPVVPSVVSRRQGLRALYELGLTAQVEALINGIPGAEGDRARIDWREAQEIRRDHPLIDYAKANIPLTDEQVDQLFILADSL